MVGPNKNKSSNHKPAEKPFIPKSILKRTTKPAPPPSPPPDPREEHNRQLALHHATLLQQRKEIELEILFAIETLIDSPSAATTDPQNPDPADAAHVLGLIQGFQPSDFDSLVEERNIDDRCGYVLCPRPPRRQQTKAKYRIITTPGEGLDGVKIVNTKDLEKWCSEVCAKYALYLRVQMDEIPAWERVGRKGDIELYDGGESSRPPQTELESLADGLDVLALERGDKDAKSFREKSMGIKVNENRTFDLPIRPPKANGSHKAIDGYKPKFRRKQEDDEDDDDDDIMDTL